MILQVRGITAGYQGSMVLENVSLDVRECSLTGIIGPNGAGKSTLLKTIMGFITPTQGDAVLRGAPLGGSSVQDRVRRGLAYVAQDRGIFAPLTVEENLRVGAFLKLDRATVQQRLDQVYARFPVLRQRQHQFAGLLSGGEVRMLEIGRFLMMEPTVVLLDEPSIGLAPRLVAQVYAEIEALRQSGLTFLIVEQNVRQILQVADVVYVLELGRNRFQGTAVEIASDDRLSSLYLGGGTEPTAGGPPV